MPSFRVTHIVLDPRGLSSRSERNVGRKAETDKQTEQQSEMQQRKQRLY